MKRITAHFNTGSGLVAQTFEIDGDFNMRMISDVDFIEVNVLNRGRALVRIADVAFWTYD